MNIPPLAYAAIVLLAALLIAIALVLIFPTADECPEGQIALWSDKGWVCRE
jgi:hypothetical protein